MGAFTLMASTTRSTITERKSANPAKYSDQSTRSGTAKEPNDGADKKEHDDSGITRPFKFIREYNAEIVTISTAIMAIFTFALFLSTHLLWKSGKEHSERELRAYVFVDNALINRIGINDHIEAVVRIRNGGQTPAYNFNSRSAVWIDDCPSYRFPVEEWKPSTISLGPESVRDLRPNSQNVVTREQWDKIKVGELAIYVAGEIQYTDIFGRQHVTKHRGFFLNYRQNWSLDGDLPIRPSEDGNGST
jgi:hypothetical protein